MIPSPSRRDAGVPLRSQGEPILSLTTPEGISDARQQRTIGAVKDLNMQRLVETGDPEIATRIAAYEMAYRMQSAAPDVMDLTKESKRDARPVRGRTRQEHLRECVPLGPAAGREGGAVRPGVPRGVGPARQP